MKHNLKSLLRMFPGLGLAAVALSVWGCTSADVPIEVEPPNSFEEVHGFWTLGDAESSWTARFEGDQLRSISEELSSGEYGSSSILMEFRDGLLRRYVEDGTLVLIGSGEEEVTRQKLHLEMKFDEAGRAVQAIRTVDGVEASLEDQQQAVTRHSKLLADLASRQRAKGDPSLICMGNEPFWNLQISGPRAVLNKLGEESREFEGRYFWSGEESLEWWGREDASRGRLSVTISGGPCEDTMSEEGGSFSHRVQVSVLDSLQASGCCRESD